MPAAHKCGVGPMLFVLTVILGVEVDVRPLVVGAEREGDYGQYEKLSQWKMDLAVGLWQEQLP